MNIREDLATPKGSLVEFADEVVFYSVVSFTQLPEQPVGVIPPEVTIPSVLNLTRLIAKNTTTTIITNFTHGQDGQEIKILGDAVTYVAYGDFLRTNSGADKILELFKVYTFTLFNGIWYENS